MNFFHGLKTTFDARPIANGAFEGLVSDCSVKEDHGGGYRSLSMKD